MSTTKNFEVGGLVSSMSALGVEKQLRHFPGVMAVQVNYVAGSASVTFDPDQTTPEAIRTAIEACGYHCGGEATPRHVCAPDLSRDKAHVHVQEHADHAAPGAQPAAPEHRMDHGGMDAMAHEMGHGSGDMQSMVRDMRNRFLVALLFAIPVFLYSPMGKMFGKFF